ncbi:MAG: DotU family type IV/VI secretion system protein [Treponema sp.]|jgi:type VI protein secretion system component VasF|nr:DotU family type IV/VI secretion system protein [Treponema sp.]
MNTITELERICNPVLICICNYWQLAAAHVQIDQENFKKRLESLLQEAKEKAGKNPSLAQEYRWIELPLIFFIDYIVKEGRFPFKHEWREFARNYKELSGDEKFFNLLDETLKYSEVIGAVTLFYVMLGLGFDGIHRSDHEYVEQRIKQCAGKLPIDFNVYAEPLVNLPSKKLRPFKMRRILTIRFGLILSFLFMVICFVINLTVFKDTTSSYRTILSAAAIDAVPKSKIIYTTAKDAHPSSVSESPSLQEQN